jgi:hypothetical protein
MKRVKKILKKEYFLRVIYKFMEEIKQRIKEINERVGEISNIFNIYGITDKELVESLKLEIDTYRDELKIITDEKLK